MHRLPGSTGHWRGLFVSMVISGWQLVDPEAFEVESRPRIVCCGESRHGPLDIFSGCSSTGLSTGSAGLSPCPDNPFRNKPESTVQGFRLSARHTEEIGKTS
jgi:hypothetical protein